jgi:SAM-dependent methyltransferase
MRSELRNSTSEESVSPFVRKCMQRIELPRRARILDLPCGFGRHAVWLAQMGHAVTAVDIDAERVAATQRAVAALSGTHSVRCMEGDAEKPLPLPANSFDLAIVIHYYAASVFETMAKALKPRGALIFETFGAQGNNWRSLPNAGLVETLLRPHFDIHDLRERPCGPEKSRAVVQALAIRRGRSSIR